MAHKAAWLSTPRLTTLGGGERVAAYWSAQLAANSSASSTDMCHGRERRRELVMELADSRLVLELADSRLVLELADCRLGWGATVGSGGGGTS